MIAQPGQTKNERNEMRMHACMDEMEENTKDKRQRKRKRGKERFTCDCDALKKINDIKK